MTFFRLDRSERPRVLLRRSLPYVLALSLVPCAGGPASPRAAEKPAAEGGWPEITPEERALRTVPQDPDAEAVVLRNERQGKIVKIADDWVNVLHYHWRLKVLRAGGKRYGEIHIRAEKFSRVSGLQARTVKPDGSVVMVAPDQIFEKLILQVGAFKLTEWVFNFPAVEMGSILEYQYDRHDNFLLFVDPWYFEGPVFTLSSRVTQAVPAGSSYMILCDLCEGTKPEISNWREGKQQGQIYTLAMRNLSGFREEVLMPPRREVSPRLEMVLQGWRDVAWTALGRQDRLFTDWASVGRYAAYYYEAATKDGLAALKPVAEAWVQGVSDPQEKIKTVFRHVQQDYRYIPYANVVGGSRSLGAILRDKSADNEEKAVLLMAALRAIGVDSAVALVSGKNGGSLNPKFFSLSQFTHAVVLVTSSDGSQTCLDPTVSYAPFGFMSWKDSGADALLLKGGAGEITVLPVKNELSTTQYRIGVKPRPDGRADLDLEARYSGEDAIEMREELVPISDSGRTQYLREWLEEERSGTTLTSETIENLDKPEEPLQIKMKAETPGLVTLAEGVLAVHGCVLSCFDLNPISRVARQHPFYVDRGWNVQQTVDISLPEGMKAAPMPPGYEAKSPIVSLSLSCISHEEEGVRCSRQFVARRNRWAAAERDGLRSLFDKIVEADRSSVAFQSGATDVKP